MKGTISINSKDRRHHHAEGNSAVERHNKGICKVRTFFEMEKNAGKIMKTIDKPRERTAAALGVSLRTVDGITSYKCGCIPHNKHIWYSPDQFNTNLHTNKHSHYTHIYTYIFNIQPYVYVYTYMFNIQPISIQYQHTNTHLQHVLIDSFIHSLIHYSVFFGIEDHVCVFHYCDQCCECNTSQMLLCVLLG